MKNNISLSNFFYSSDKIKHPEKIVNKLNKGHIIKTYYIVAFEENASKPVILPSVLFLQKYYQNRLLKIIGIFSSMEEALEYLRVLCDISYKKYDDISVSRLVDEFDVSILDEYYPKEN